VVVVVGDVVVVGAVVVEAVVVVGVVRVCGRWCLVLVPGSVAGGA